MKQKQQKQIKPKSVIVVKINVGNIPPGEVDNYMTKTISKLQEKDKLKF